MRNGDYLITTIDGVEYKVTKVKRVWSSGSYYVAHDMTNDKFLSSFMSVAQFRRWASSMQERVA